MPRGEELEQLPMANIAPGAGDDSTGVDRELLQDMMMIPVSQLLFLVTVYPGNT
ncbi:hypothetical protein [Cytobacillus sp. NCCP-133]|uniref:hypothetical protein n=1 Tax=Cytobacillus sp. NCCP-133 TaxID=766848 RepID=UPI00222E9207|nr:hypothetical protein [Cytobacillus sp. NCCP-133]GLB58092.1 hypothetical protein NCCP133_02250 [Cytobacillus sp. NCCP-133]